MDLQSTFEHEPSAAPLSVKVIPDDSSETGRFNGVSQQTFTNPESR